MFVISTIANQVFFPNSFFLVYLSARRN